MKTLQSLIYLPTDEVFLSDWAKSRRFVYLPYYYRWLPGFIAVALFTLCESLYACLTGKLSIEPSAFRNYLVPALSQNLWYLFLTVTVSVFFQELKYWRLVRKAL